MIDILAANRENVLQMLHRASGGIDRIVGLMTEKNDDGLRNMLSDIRDRRIANVSKLIDSISGKGKRLSGHMGLKIRPARQLKGRVVLPGDKSLSHRALILAALAEGVSRIENCLIAGVTEAMIECLRAMGVDVKIEGQPERPVVVIGGRKLHGLMAPEGPLNCHGSATTMRLLAGVMAGQSFPSVLDGNQSLRMRPMDRIVEPLEGQRSAH